MRSEAFSSPLGIRASYNKGFVSCSEVQFSGSVRLRNFPRRVFCRGVSGFHVWFHAACNPDFTLTEQQENGAKGRKRPDPTSIKLQGTWQNKVFNAPGKGSVWVGSHYRAIKPKTYTPRINNSPEFHHSLHASRYDPVSCGLKNLAAKGGQHGLRLLLAGPHGIPAIFRIWGGLRNPSRSSQRHQRSTAQPPPQRTPRALAVNRYIAT